MIHRLLSFIRDPDYGRDPAFVLRTEPVPVSALTGFNPAQGADLIDLIELNKRWEIEDACARRKARRLAKLSASARKGARTRHSRNMAALRPLKGESQ